jgi:hypothetical protein
MGLVLSICAGLGSAHAWTINTNDSGAELNWAETQIGWTLNTTGDHALDLVQLDRAINDAAGQWNGVEDSRVEFSYLGATTVAAADYTDGQNTIYFEPDWTLDSSLLAVTYVWSLEDGTISAFDMAVNTADHSWSTEAAMDTNDLHNTITHEFGHALGLAHSELNYASMYESTFEGETEKRDISTDDEHGMRYLYGSVAYEPELAESPSGCSAVGRQANLWAGLLLLPALLIRRRS